ncbi:hypothetical protein [Ichthyenterobacterium magnum]|uniref:Uncharacterized protein n=1 Tax=Ichthyenterobacterium magnum TaxID=1230530 RepID=A0A420DF62_9FLAO|nr:hypothetical protein [Ichthyenterobacterium magnum]RKE90287.1 hypothetical protein BXY80_2754 [Ichthyenterobacterium magnum]RKE90293.1 hypothetical protein BXY80_2760 [Ichthyenterobacterium magnum]
MSENRFIEKFQHKTVSELEYILENKKSYNEQAIAASIQILKKRNGKTPELKSVENEIKIEKEKKEVARKKIIEEVKKKNNITDDPNAPELHSKKVIFLFSAIFSTIFGAVLLMYNMKQTGNSKGRIQVLIFGILYTVVSIVIIESLNVKTNLALLFNFGGAGILIEYFWNKFIGKEFQYRKRSWVKPAIISVLITIPLILAAIYRQ